jgi:hypothetical protein
MPIIIRTIPPRFKSENAPFSKKDGAFFFKCFYLRICQEAAQHNRRFPTGGWHGDGVEQKYF